MKNKRISKRKKDINTKKETNKASIHEKFSTYFTGPATLVVLLITLYIAYKSTFTKAELHIFETKLFFDDSIVTDSLQTETPYVMVKIYNNGNKTTSLKEITFKIKDEAFNRINTDAEVISFPNYIRPGYTWQYIFKLKSNAVKKMDEKGTVQFWRYQYPLKTTYNEWLEHYNDLKGYIIGYPGFSLNRPILIEVSAHLINETIIEKTEIKSIAVEDVDKLVDKME